MGIKSLAWTEWENSKWFNQLTKSIAKDTRRTNCDARGSRSYPHAWGITKFDRKAPIYTCTCACNREMVYHMSRKLNMPTIWIQINKWPFSYKTVSYFWCSFVYLCIFCHRNISSVWHCCVSKCEIKALGAKSFRLDGLKSPCFTENMSSLLLRKLSHYIVTMQYYSWFQYKERLWFYCSYILMSVPTKDFYKHDTTCMDRWGPKTGNIYMYKLQFH